MFICFIFVSIISIASIGCCIHQGNYLGNDRRRYGDYLLTTDHRNHQSTASHHVKFGKLYKVVKLIKYGHQVLPIIAVPKSHRPLNDRLMIIRKGSYNFARPEFYSDNDDDDRCSSSSASTSSMDSTLESSNCSSLAAISSYSDASKYLTDSFSGSNCSSMTGSSSSSSTALNDHSHRLSFPKRKFLEKSMKTPLNSIEITPKSSNHICSHSTMINDNHGGSQSCSECNSWSSSSSSSAASSSSSSTFSNAENTKFSPNKMLIFNHHRYNQKTKQLPRIQINKQNYHQR